MTTARHRPAAKARSGGGALLAPRPAAGAALLIAMVLLTVVATLAAGMVWQQWRAVQVEAAERGRVQGAWLLRGALDYGRLILREDARSGDPTHLGAPWATPLEETRISTMLALDRDNSADSEVQAFLSGAISDAQARWNLRHLVAEGKLQPEALAVLERLCASAGLPGGTAARLAQQLLVASGPASAPLGTAFPLMPATADDLGWLGLDEASLARLLPLVVLLPERTPVNLNTAPREVLAAVLPGVDLGSADRLVQARARTPFKTPEDAARLLGGQQAWPAGLVDVRSRYFEVHGRLRLDDRVLSERYLVQRGEGLAVTPIGRLRSASLVAAER